MSEPTEAPTQPIPTIRKERTPAQLETLRLAREKAAKVRSMNAETRRKQGEIDKAAAEDVKKQKVEKLEREYAAIQQKPVEEEPEPKVEEEEEEVEYVYKKKPARKKRVVVVEKSDSEDELEIAIPKAKKPIDPKQERYTKMYNKMFDL